MRLSATDLRFAYGRQQVIDGVSFGAGEGEFIGIVGPNGAGKTTLMQLMTGYLHAHAGRVEVTGKDVREMRRAEVARHVSFVPQKSQYVFSFPVLEMVLMGRQPYSKLSGFEGAEDVALARQALKRLEIEELEQKQFSDLSGGEQQLVLLARALAQDTPIMVFDEPATFLDIRHQWQVLKLLVELARAGRTIIASFHDLNLAARACTKVLLLDKGRIRAEGAPADVFDSTNLTAMYGVPLTVHVRDGRPLVELPELELQ